MEKGLSLALSLAAMSAILCAPSSSAAEASFDDGETVVHTILVGGFEPDADGDSAVWDMGGAEEIGRKEIRLAVMGDRLVTKTFNGSRGKASYATLARRDYAGSFVYLNGELERVELAEGYVDGSGGYHCYVRDAQGSVRAVVSAGDSVEETNHYYPYGALFGVSAMRGGAQPRKYGGKELERQYGLDMYDSQARWYDPLLCRATTPDPLAERTPAVSPYVWCAANPVNRIDPTGMASFWQGSTLLGNDGVNDGRVLILKTSRSSFADPYVADSMVRGANINEKKQKNS